MPSSNPGRFPARKAEKKGPLFDRRRRPRGQRAIISFCIRHIKAIVTNMGQRRESRERAVQFLFQHDLNPPENLEEALEHFWTSQRGPAIAEEKARATWGQKADLPPPTAEELATRLFADKLIRGVLEHRASLDQKIQDQAQNWDLRRMAVVDRNILRLAIYEMLYRDDIPPIVSINEAVDVAKKYSTQDSGKFVNGILDKIKGQLSAGPRPEMNPSPSIVPPPGAGLAAEFFADLHLHTVFSDGTFTPEEVARRGAQAGLAALALTDHDTVEGCARMAAACRTLGVEFITGVELTAEFEGHEVHLLGYFIDTQREELLGEIKKFQAVRQERIREMVCRINKLGYPLRAETVFALANCHSPAGRTWAARWCRKGIARRWTRPLNVSSRKAAPPGCPSTKSPPPTRRR